VPERMQGIYAIVNAVNGNRYIGSSVDCEARFRVHIRLLRAGTHVNPKLLAAWRKYGEQVFRLEIIEAVSERGMLLERETAWIPCGHYNIAPKADRPPGHWRPYTIEERVRLSAARKGKPRPHGKLSEETKRKIADALTGRSFSDERKANISRATRGTGSLKRSLAMVGNKRGAVPCSIEKRAKIAAALRRPDVAAKLSAAQKGRKHTPQHVANLAAALRGKRRSAESCSKMRAARLAFLARTRKEDESNVAVA
jgi:group I intron endonuclease